MPCSTAHDGFREPIAAGAVFQRPFAHGAIGMDTNVIIEGQPLAAESASRNPILNWEAATPDYFRAMDIRLLQGRLFDERDTRKIAAGGRHRAVARRATVAGPGSDRATHAGIQ